MMKKSKKYQPYSGWAYWRLLIHALQQWNLVQLYPKKRRSKDYMRHHLGFADISIFRQKSVISVVSGSEDKCFVLVYNFWFFTFYQIFKDCFNQYNYNFDVVSKISYFKPPRSGFPKWGRLVEDKLGKMTKNCMKITNSTFLR